MKHKDVKCMVKPVLMDAEEEEGGYADEDRHESAKLDFGSIALGNTYK